MAPRPFPSARPSACGTIRNRLPRAAKIGRLTPELRRRIIEIYETEYAGGPIQTREVHAQIANKLWIKRQLVADVIREMVQSKVALTDELKARAIEMYQRFVESGHRPEGGRRRAISSALGLPYKQVMKIIREWSMAEYETSPTPNPTRLQLFEIEKMYWDELNEQRYRLTELPTRIAEQLGYVTRWQVLRWLDVLHDDERAFANVPDPTPEAQQQILDAYVGVFALTCAARTRLALQHRRADCEGQPSPGPQGTSKHRHKMRAEYPQI